MKAIIILLLGSSAWAGPPPTTAAPTSPTPVPAPPKTGVVEFEVRGTTVSGYACDATGRAAAASAVSSDVLTQAQSVRGDAYLVSMGAQCTSVSAPAVTVTEAPTTSAPTTSSPITAAPIYNRERRSEEISAVEHRRAGPVKMFCWATVGVPVSSTADAASLTPAMFVPTTAGFTWNQMPGKLAHVSAPNEPKCTFAETAGYTATMCDGAVLASDCDLACAENYSLPLTTPPTFLTKTCTTNGGVFQLRGCYPTGCKMGGESCTAPTECCQYATPNLTLEKRQSACSAGSRAKGKVKGKGKSKGKAAVSTCAPLSIPKVGKVNPKAKKTVGIAVGVGLGVSALGVAAVALRRRNRVQKTRATTPAAANSMVTVSV